MIKLANKINLSAFALERRLRCHQPSRNLSVCMAGVLIALCVSLATSAQVPPRSEAAQEQREEKAPLVFTDDPLSLTRWCTLTFVGKDGKEAVLDFCGEKLTYSGDLGVDEPARLFFEALMENFAVCKAATKEKREE